MDWENEEPDALSHAAHEEHEVFFIDLLCLFGVLRGSK
jgi:hypothetical protein